MKKMRVILAAMFCSLALAASAQDTNDLKTVIGVFENQAGVVIIKGYVLVGSISAGGDMITVLCKESTDANRSHKADGLAIEIGGNLPDRERILVDYDEIDSLLGGINYLNTLTHEVTPFPSFEASYSTKAGLQVIADSPRKDSGVKMYLEYADHPRILMTPVQLMQLYALIGQAKNNLDSINSGR